MQGPKPSDADLDALLAFLATVDFVPPRPVTATDAVARGREVFRAHGCHRCHAPPLYTTPRVYKVGLESKDDVYEGFNPPSLRGVGTRGPWLHDARARTLEDVFRHHPDPQGVPIELRELADLVAFLRSL
jgi:cytochrome c peroxidase